MAQQKYIIVYCHFGGNHPSYRIADYVIVANLQHRRVKGFKEIQNKTNSENRHLVFLIFKKEQENDEVGDISSLFQRHCQTNKLDYKQAVLYIYKVGKL